MECLVTNSQPRPRLAVLIDAENVPPRVTDALFQAISHLGDANFRRAYGDFADARLTGWQEPLHRHAVTLQQQIAGHASRASVQAALTIDAMDLLHSGLFDGFCLVTSSDDFTRLASRIREQGVDVHGFGRRGAPPGFRAACRHFVFLEHLVLDTVADEDSDIPAGAPATSPASGAAPLHAATQLLRRAMRQVPHKNGWTHLSPLGKAVRRISPDFDPRAYGHTKLLTLVAQTGAFELNQQDGSVMVRATPSGTAE